MNKSNHTELPWAVHKTWKYMVCPISDIDKKNGFAIDPAVNHKEFAKKIVYREGSKLIEFKDSVVMEGEAEANAALIVHRVNNWDKLVEALEFYADDENWKLEDYQEYDAITSHAEQDKGDKAKQALDQKEV